MKQFFTVLPLKRESNFSLNAIYLKLWRRTVTVVTQGPTILTGFQWFGTDETVPLFRYEANKAFRWIRSSAPSKEIVQGRPLPHVRRHWDVQLSSTELWTIHISVIKLTIWKIPFRNDGIFSLIDSTFQPWIDNFHIFSRLVSEWNSFIVHPTGRHFRRM